MKMKLIVFSVLIVLLEGCISNGSSCDDRLSDLSYANCSFKHNDLVTAYKILESNLDDRNSESIEAITFIRSNKGILEAGLSTFSEQTLKNRIAFADNKIVAARYEKNRLLLFKIVATENQYNE